MNKREAKIEALHCAATMLQSDLGVGFTLEDDGTSADDAARIRGALQEIIESLRCRAERLQGHYIGRKEGAS